MCIFKLQIPFMKHFLATALAFSICTSVSAQVKEQDTITYLDEVVLVDPARKPQVTGITQSSIIGPEVFGNYSPVDLPAALNQISGVYVLSGALNTNRITIRGVGARTPFGTDKLRLYYNNIPVTSGTGFSELEAFDMENLFTMEVVKGPKGSAFGANLGGAILLQTKSPTEGTTSLTNSFTAGSYGLLKNNLGFSHKEGSLGIELRYNHMDLQGYRENSRFDRDALLLTTTHNLGPKSSLGLLLNHVDYRSEIASSLGLTDFEADPTQAAFTWAASQGYEANRYTLSGITYHQEFGPRLQQNTSFYYSYLDHYEPRPFNILDEYTHTYGFRTIFEGITALFGKEARYTLGAELLKDEYHWGVFENLYEQNEGQGSLQGEAIGNNSEFRRQFYAFGTFQLALNEFFSAQLGLTLNNTSYDFYDRFNQGTDNRSASRQFDPAILPSLDLSYRPPGGIWHLFANASQGFSNPSLEETLTPSGVINPEIEQELGNSYEVGATLSLDWLALTAGIYRMDIRNLLVAQRVGEDQFIGRNAGKTRHTGLEIDATFLMKLGKRTTLSPFLNYTYSDHKFVRFVDGDNDYSGNPLTGVPRHRINTGMRLEYSRAFYWTSTLQQVGKIPLTDANTLSSPGYAIINSRMGFRNKFGSGFTAGIDAGLNNILNQEYAASVLINAVGFGNSEPRYYYPGNGRNFYAGMEIKYEW